MDEKTKKNLRELMKTATVEGMCKIHGEHKEAAEAVAQWFFELEKEKIAPSTGKVFKMAHSVIVAGVREMDAYAAQGVNMDKEEWDDKRKAEFLHDIGSNAMSIASMATGLACYFDVVKNMLTLIQKKTEANGDRKQPQEG